MIHCCFYAPLRCLEAVRCNARGGASDAAKLGDLVLLRLGKGPAAHSVAYLVCCFCDLFAAAVLCGLLRDGGACCEVGECRVSNLHVHANTVLGF